MDASSDSEGLTLRLTPSPANSNSTIGSAVCMKGSSTTAGGDKSYPVVCRLCETDGLTKGNIERHLTVNHSVTKLHNTYKLYTLLPRAGKNNGWNANLSATENKIIDFFSTTVNSTVTSNGCNGASGAPSEYSSASSASSFSESSTTKLVRKCARYRCNICGTTVYTQSAMMGHLFVEHPMVKSPRSLKRQRMTVILDRLSQADVDKHCRLSNINDTEAETDNVVGDGSGRLEMVDGWLIEHVPDVMVNGDVVWAKLNGFPWWPGLLIHEPGNTFLHFRRPQESDEIEYHVLFFDDKTCLQRAWLSESNVIPFESKSQKKMAGKTAIKYKKRMDEAIKWVDEVSDWSSPERRQFFSSKMDESH
jgi:hypothetical protein